MDDLAILRTAQAQGVVYLVSVLRPIRSAQNHRVSSGDSRFSELPVGIGPDRWRRTKLQMR